MVIDFASEGPIPEDLIASYAIDPLSPYDKFFNLIQRPDSALKLKLRCYLAQISSAAVRAAFLNDQFAGLYKEDDESARIWIAQRIVAREVSVRRLKQLLDGSGSIIRSAKDLTAFANIPTDVEGLTKLSNFSHSDSSLCRNEYSFITCLSNPNFNSTYWLQNAFRQQALWDSVRVRLDPFLFGDSAHFASMGFKMIVYAMPLRWSQIESLRGMNYGRMQSEKAWDSTAVTEYCWERRDDGIHFVCEELPRPELVDERAARYLHAIYDPKQRAVIHLDGALRIYRKDEIATRALQHVRNSGKAGARRKIFRLDQPIPRDTFSLIAQAFFIWNEDFAAYFRKTLAS